MAQQPSFGMLIRIKENAPYFCGEKARIAYIGEDGISVYLTESKFDDCIPLNNDEWETLKEER